MAMEIALLQVPATHRGGYFWSKQIQFNAYTLAFGVVSIVFIYLFEYKDLNLSPFFYDSEMSWRGCHWICYFYPIFILPILLYWLYGYLYGALCRFIEELGKASYEIFLMQMLIIGVISPHKDVVNTFLPHSFLPIIWVFSLGVGYMWFIIRIRMIKNNKLL
jgi:hypothetical protein